MNTSKKLSSTKRRDVMIAGLAGASAFFGRAAWAQSIESKGKIERKLMEPMASMIPGIAKVRVREQTYQPGASSKAKMQNAMICECTRGSLEVTADDKTFTVNKGDIWTCSAGMVEAISNKASGPGTMRVFDLLTA